MSDLTKYKLDMCDRLVESKDGDLYDVEEVDEFIESLAADRNDLKSNLEKWAEIALKSQKQVKKVEEENNRYREALEEIMKPEWHDRYIGIAKQALEPRG